MKKTTLSTDKQRPAELMGRYEFLINRPAQRIKEMTEKALQPLKIGPKQYRILVTLQSEGPASQRAIGEILKIDRSTMVLHIDDLEKKKLIVRKSDPKDRRYNLLHITNQGKQLLQQAQKLVKNAEQKFLAPLTAIETQEMRKLLSKLFEDIPNNV